MPYKKKFKVDMTFYIERDGNRQIIDNLADPSPTVFEGVDHTEVRFNVIIKSDEDFLKYHAMDSLLKKEVTIGIIYDNDIELKSTFTVTDYERRFGSDRGSILTHVIKGHK